MSDSTTIASVADSLAPCFDQDIAPISLQIVTTQLRHRLNLLASWFGGFDHAVHALGQRRIVELGCGQGDMTAALAHMTLQSSTPATLHEPRVMAVDPARLDYGSPLTLGQAQGVLSRSKVGPAIQWIQKDPMDFFVESHGAMDYIVLAHCLFYLPSAEYLASLLQRARESAQQQGSGRPVKLLLAEWGMRASSAAAEKHVLAVQAQLAAAIPESNIRTVLEPETIKTMATKAGWTMEREHWVVSPEMDDARWEIGATRSQLKKDELKDSAREIALRLEKAMEEDPSIVCMDVWTSAWTVSA